MGDDESFDFCDPLNPPPECADDLLGGAINNGQIWTSGKRAQGILFDDYGGTVINTGQIVTTGIQSNGIRIQGAGRLRVENSGLIKVGQFEGNERSFAIMMNRINNGFVDGTKWHLTLHEGSVLVGDVFLGRADLSTVNFGAGLNAAVAIYMGDTARLESGIDNAEDFKNKITVNSANDVHVVRDFVLYSADTTDYLAQDAVMGGLTRSVQSLASSQMSAPPQPVAEGASAGLELPSFCQGQWHSPFGTTLNSDGGDSYTRPTGKPEFCETSRLNSK